jgi:hypothetical protein
VKGFPAQDRQKVGTAHGFVAAATFGVAPGDLSGRIAPASFKTRGTAFCYGNIPADRRQVKSE